MTKKCEFCGEKLWDTPDDVPWRVADRGGLIHVFCSLICALRYFGKAKLS